ncbi:MAG: low molecular weight protein arginine phosphatase [Anaerolineae bacterium]|nr:low molecular weight protein arginine phosphatase [Gemmatimonadaceae bacterium]
MAEAIARGMLAERKVSDIEVGSAGTAAWDGAPASDGALLVALEQEIDLTGHRSRMLTPELAASYDLILTMGPQHLERVRAFGSGDRAFLLSDYASRGAESNSVNDPFDGDLSVYRETFDELDREIRRIIDRLAAENATGGS